MVIVNAKRNTNRLNQTCAAKLVKLLHNNSAPIVTQHVTVVQHQCQPVWHVLQKHNSDL